MAGLSAGWWLSRAEATVNPGNLSAAPTKEMAELVNLRSELTRLEEERALLAARNDALELEAETVRNERSLMDEVLQEAAHREEAPEPAQATTTPDPGWRRGGARPTPEQMAEFRKNFEDQQGRMRDRLDEQLAQMNDPNAIENFNALMEYRQEEQQLQRQMRDATTDAARAKIEAQLREARQSSRQLLNDQQDAMLRGLAASSGIKDAGAQQKFVEDLRTTLDNPFFQMEPMLVGGSGGAGGRGGPRGFGGGGFGNGRPPAAPAN
jgi:hypothetical protein